MQVLPLAVPGAFAIEPRVFGDDRGAFLEWFKDEAFAAAAGHRLGLAQANCSVSRAGVVRGVHFAEVPPGQAKYVTCVRGAVLDVAVDIRIGSPTFRRHDAVRLDDTDHRAIYLAEGLGHAFQALTDDATVVYLCSEPYAPGREHGIHPLDPALGLPWELEPVLSDKDASAPSLSEAQAQGLLPTWEACEAYVSALRGAHA